MRRTRTGMTNAAVLTGLALTLTLTGCGAVPQTNETTTPKQAADFVPSSSPTRSQTFFVDKFSGRTVPVWLAPDARITKEPGLQPTARENVLVYLPLYPGAVRTNGLTGMTATYPMTQNLVDGTLQFVTSASIGQVMAWYNKEFAVIGYQLRGEGTSGGRDGITLTYDLFNPGIVTSGSNQLSPELLVSARRRDGQTQVQVEPQFIVTPVRPADTFLPNGMTRVVLTEGKQSRTIVNAVWTARVVRQINALLPAVSGIHGCPADIVGRPTTVAATFYGNSGRSIPVNIDFSCGLTITVGADSMALNGTEALLREFTAPFGHGHAATP